VDAPPGAGSKCYIHPELLNSYLEGNLVLQMKGSAEHELRGNLDGLSAEEAAVLAILRQRLNGTVTRATAT
jgi:DNA topoisomerase I